VSWGPYRYVRHPFYASYCLTWVAGAAACGSAVVVSTFVLMLAMYVRAARFEERKFLRSPQAADYANYQRSTGMLVPRSELLVKLVSRSAKTPPHIFPK